MGGVDPNARYMDGATALHLAAGNSGNAGVLGVLLNAGADVNARTEGGSGGATPLHWAAWSTAPSVVSVVQVLLDAGADPGARDRHGDTPFRWVREGSRLVGTDAYFVLKLAQPSPCDDLTYDRFWEETTPSQVRGCLAGGADPNAHNVRMETALHYAVRYSVNPAVVAVLLDAGADPNVRSEGGLGAEAPLHWAAWNASPAVVSVVRLLLNAGADPAARDYNGGTPFDWIDEESPLMGTDVYWILQEASTR